MIFCCYLVSVLLLRFVVELSSVCVLMFMLVLMKGCIWVVRLVVIRLFFMFFVWIWCGVLFC